MAHARTCARSKTSRAALCTASGEGLWANPIACGATTLHETHPPQRSTCRTHRWGSPYRPRSHPRCAPQRAATQNDAEENFTKSSLTVVGVRGVHGRAHHTIHLRCPPPSTTSSNTHAMGTAGAMEPPLPPTPHTHAPGTHHHPPGWIWAGCPLQHRGRPSPHWLRWR